MKIAIIIIAAVEVVRMIQDFIQIQNIKSEKQRQIEIARDAFIQSLKRTDDEFFKEVRGGKL